MTETIQLTAADDHSFDAYVARPAGEAKRGLVVVQEIFGVNRHIRATADRFAAEGYLAVAPALFDRVERGVELAYDAAGLEKGRGLAMKVAGDALKDIAAAIRWLRAETGQNPAVVGYCFGGTMAWLAALNLGDDTPTAAVPYYGGQIAMFLSEPPKCPVEMHFGAKDAHIPLTDVEKIRRERPEVTVHVYDAGHGFACSERADFDAASDALAMQRTLAFLAAHMPL